jgi:hypothetical protein
MYVPYKALGSISTTTKFNTLPPIGQNYNIATIWVRPTTKWPSTTGGLKLLVGKAASQAAAPTVFASLQISKTYTVNKWYAMTVTKKEFLASDCVRCTVSAKKTNAKGVEMRIKIQDA